MSVLTLVILFKLENAKDAYLVSATRSTLALMHLLKFNPACFRAYARKSGLSQSVISHAIFSSHIVHEHACIHDDSHILMHLCSHLLHCCVHMVLFRSIPFDKFSFAYSVLSNYIPFSPHFRLYIGTCSVSLGLVLSEPNIVLAKKGRSTASCTLAT